MKIGEKNEHLLLLWLVARKHGLVRGGSAQHANELLTIPDGELRPARDALRARGYVSPDKTSWDVTPEGEAALKRGVLE